MILSWHNIKLIFLIPLFNTIWQAFVLASVALPERLTKWHCTLWLGFSSLCSVQCSMLFWMKNLCEFPFFLHKYWTNWWHCYQTIKKLYKHLFYNLSTLKNFIQIKHLVTCLYICLKTKSKKPTILFVIYVKNNLIITKSLTAELYEMLHLRLKN